jgi:outer membrane lipoprotein-sorting protein
MTGKDNIENKLEKLSESITPDQDFVKKVMTQIESKPTPATQPTSTLEIWRIIMKSKMTKLATAAAIGIIALLSITFLDKIATPAWAIEETIELLKKFNAIHFSGTTLDEDGNEISFEGWARANEKQTASNHLRLETETGKIDVVSGTQRYQYDPATQIVQITEGYGPAMSPWVGADFFESLKKITLDWNETYGKDPATDRNRVFVTCSHPASPNPRSWWFEFDVESKLLVSMKQWENMNRQGTPSFDAKSITFFEDLPDELFHFEIPEGAKTAHGLQDRMNKLQDPNAGMPIENMTEDQACVEVAQRYWQAIIEQDWQTVALLYPIETADVWEHKYNGSSIEKIVQITEPYEEDKCKSGKIVSCTIGFSDGNTTTIKMVILFREINSQRSCVIANTWRSE